jgi:ankyrin repeat protein
VKNKKNKIIWIGILIAICAFVFVNIFFTSKSKVHGKIPVDVFNILVKHQNSLLEKHLKKGLNPNGKVLKDETLISIALNERNFEAVKLLLKYGANTAQVNEGTGLSGATALQMASYIGSYEIVKLLLEYGAKVNAMDNNGATALTSACFSGHCKIARLLIKNGAKIDVMNKQKQDALILATYNKHSECVELLLKNGANPEVRDPNGYTPLLWAISHNDINTVKVLLQHNAEINDTIRTKYNKKQYVAYTPLNLAIMQENINIVKLLLENKKLDINKIGEDGLTPLDNAIKLVSGDKNGNEIISLLKSHGAKTASKLKASKE